MAVYFSPEFNDQTFDANGNPAVGYKLFTYVAGSTTKQATYTDSTGLVAQTNPIILNASGYPTNGSIWLTGNQTYKFVLAPSTDTDPPTSPVKTIDGIKGVNDSSSSNTQWVSSGVTPTYVSTLSFTLPGDQTGEFHTRRRLQFAVTAGTVYGSIKSSVFGALTTVTCVMDTGQALDSGLSSVNLSVLRGDRSALPTAPNPLVIGAVTALTAAQAIDNMIIISGNVAPITLTLPASADCPNGGPASFLNASAFDVTIARAGADQINPSNSPITSIVLKPGDNLSLTLFSTVWEVSGGTAQLPYASVFSTSLAANGRQSLPGGFLIQWGTVTSSAVADVAVTFPRAFAAAPYFAGGNIQSAAVGYVVATNTPTTTGMNVGAWTGATGATRVAAPVLWCAIGKEY